MHSNRKVVPQRRTLKLLFSGRTTNRSVPEQMVNMIIGRVATAETSLVNKL